ncbi:hypothetical protein N658DRAFT_365284 [Parathielavia hyrcaniae]|uniref:Uncharacterized protein n=1 Tax=Parathielavia hyrcaniae TaxID=113614 RepID=A0AAN6PQV7_9PEZI|nr:hypothetical protein N658DRAFT_365284 [Parathielavia hyrcaniae]
MKMKYTKLSRLTDVIYHTFPKQKPASKLKPETLSTQCSHTLPKHHHHCNAIRQPNKPFL